MLKKTLLYALCTGSLLAQQASAALPATLLYQKHPIDALCLENTQANIPIHLANCGLHTQKGLQKLAAHTLKISQGFMGYDYGFLINGTLSASTAYSYYRYLGSANHIDYVYQRSSGGGSGSFSALLAIQRKGETLTVTSLANGDRCNGGIQAATWQKDSKNNENIRYRVALTPYALFKLAAGATTQKIRPYRDLADSSASCIAEAIYQYDVSDANAANNSSNPSNQLFGVQLTSHSAAAQKSMGQPATYQTCFDQLLQQQVTGGHNTLSSAQLAAFSQAFLRQCVRK